MDDKAFVPDRYVLIQYPNSDALLEGTETMRGKGWKDVDTHTPYPVHGLEKALGLGRPLIPTIVLGGAIAGIVAGYSMMYFMNVVDFPLNIANRPAHSPPTMIPITFELAILLAGISAVVGSLFGLFKLPQPYHPLFESENFRRASIDGMFLSVKLAEGESADRAMDEARRTGATMVELVEESER